MPPLSFNPQLSTRQISIIVLMTATCISTNYLMLGLVNVKIMDLIVFALGLSLGSTVGVTVGVLTWLIYGTLNPYGFSLPILIATCIGESVYGLAGGALKKSNFYGSPESDSRYLTAGAKFAILGFLLTFIYDQFTNLVSALTIGLPVYVGLVMGVPFSIVHEASNAAFFLIGAAPLIELIKRFNGRGR
ncbi:MAG: hypothetical protein ACUVV4_04070 [Candidatus Bathyarchaeia archaeon]